MNVGNIGEKYAQKYLQGEGYYIRATNFSWRRGEIDIVCEYNDTLIFVEVKARKSTSGGQPYQNVTSEKLRKIRHTGMHYAYVHGLSNMRMRIDVISIHIYRNGALHKLKHFKNVYL